MAFVLSATVTTATTIKQDQDGGGGGDDDDDSNGQWKHTESRYIIIIPHDSPASMVAAYWLFNLFWYFLVQYGRVVVGISKAAKIGKKASLWRDDESADSRQQRRRRR